MGENKKLKKEKSELGRVTKKKKNFFFLQGRALLLRGVRAISLSDNKASWGMGLSRQGVSKQRGRRWGGTGQGEWEGGGRAKGKERKKARASFPRLRSLPAPLPPYFSSSLVSCSWEEEASTAARKEAKSSFAFASKRDVEPPPAQEGFSAAEDERTLRRGEGRGDGCGDGGGVGACDFDPAAFHSHHHHHQSSPPWPPPGGVV